MSTTPRSTLQLLVLFLLPRLHPPSATSNQQPLFVGLQGPQGIGKTWLAKSVQEELLQAHRINTVIISLDDFYLTRKEQHLLETQLNNRLLRGRGLPGTHDLELARKTLLNLKNINQINSENVVELPIYDKSIQVGLGDRIGFRKVGRDNTTHDQVVHLVILEGWMVGFLPLETDQLKLKYNQSLDLTNTFTSQFTFGELLEINQNLNNYCDSIWSFLDLCILLVPQDLGFIWRWRLQQEENMKASNGGIGMSEEQVHEFISRYMPCYELYGIPADEEEGGQRIKWSLKIILDQDRKVVDVKLPLKSCFHILHDI